MDIEIENGMQSGPVQLLTARQTDLGNDMLSGLWRGARGEGDCANYGIECQEGTKYLRLHLRTAISIHVG